VAYAVKRGNTDPPLRATLRAGGKPLPLTDVAQVRFHMRPVIGATGPVIDGLATVIDAPKGRVQYQWAPGDTAVPGWYDTEWWIQWNDGTERTIPNDGWVALEVVGSLA
jgi:hypothetical protein